MVFKREDHTMNRTKLHHTPVVVVKTGGFASGVTALATVGIFAVTAFAALTIHEAVKETQSKINKFVGEPEEAEVKTKEPSKELVKDTMRTKIKRFAAKSFLKNIFK